MSSRPLSTRPRKPSLPDSTTPPRPPEAALPPDCPVWGTDLRHHRHLGHLPSFGRGWSSPPVRHRHQQHCALHPRGGHQISPDGLQRAKRAAPLVPGTLTHTLTRSHSDGSSHLGFLRTRHLMALWLNDQMLGRHVCDTKHGALPHFILPTTIVISSLLTRNVKLRG